MARKLIGSMGKPIDAAFIKEYVVKLSSKYLHLYL